MYEVDSILYKKRFNGRWLYLVKWSGFDYSECTWEPKENLVSAIKPWEKFLEGAPIDLLKKKMDKYEKDLKTYESVERKYNKYKNIIDRYVVTKEREMDNATKFKSKNSRGRSRSMMVNKETKLKKILLGRKRSDSSGSEECIGIKKKRESRSGSRKDVDY